MFGGAAQTRLARIWSPQGLTDRGALLLHYRSRLVVGIAAATWMVTMPICLVGVAVFHWAASILLGANAAYLAAIIGAQGIGAWWLLRTGVYRALDGTIVTRAEQTGRFRRMVVLHLLVLAVWFGAGALTLWILFAYG